LERKKGALQKHVSVFTKRRVVERSRALGVIGALAALLVVK